MQHGNGKRVRPARRPRMRRNVLCPYPRCSLAVRELAGLPLPIQRKIDAIPELNPELLEDLIFTNQ